MQPVEIDRKHLLVPRGHGEVSHEHLIVDKVERRQDAPGFFAGQARLEKEVGCHVRKESWPQSTDKGVTKVDLSQAFIIIFSDEPFENYHALFSNGPVYA